MSGSSASMVRFGPFEVDLQSGELRKQGLRVTLQEQPFQVLAALLERPGEIVSREELVRRLWPDVTIGDFERGLNAAVTRLRQALCDSADRPKYVETVARRGYRFIGGVVTAGQGPSSSTAAGPVRKKFSWAILAASMAAVVTVIALRSARFFVRDADNFKPPSKVLPLTTGTGVERNASFSPDGSQVVYEWQPEGGKRHLYIKVVGAGEPTPLTSGETAEDGPAWSPDGRLIAFLRQFDEGKLAVFVIPPVGGVERKIVDIASPPYWVLVQFYRRLAWTRDGRHLIVSAPDHAGGSERLLLVSIDNGETSWLTEAVNRPLFGDREPAVSPDGLLVAFARGELGSNQVIHLLPLSNDLRPAGSPQPLAAAGRARSPAWSPDGKRILYSAVNPGSNVDSYISVAGLNASTAPQPLLALGVNASLPSVSRLGGLAYARIHWQGDIWRQQISTAGGPIPPAVRLISSSSLDSNAQYSPDGSRIAFASNRSGYREIWTCGSDGSRCAQATSFNGGFLSGTPRWSPDGKQIVLDSSAAGNNDVFVVDAGGGAPRRLTNKTHGFVPSWSKDGKWIYFCSVMTGRQEIWKIPSQGGNAVQVTRNGGYIAFESTQGDALYYTKGEENAALFRSALDGSGETEVLRGVANRAFVVTHDKIYYLRKEADGKVNIRERLISRPVDSAIATAPESVYLGLSSSPDGRFLIYSRIRLASNLMLVENFH